jgi:glutathione S-transferase
MPAQLPPCAIKGFLVRVFDSHAILLYLAEKTGRFLSGNTPKARGHLPSWLMFIATGIGPALKYLKDHQSRNFCTLSSGTAALRVGAFVFNMTTLRI